MVERDLVARLYFATSRIRLESYRPLGGSDFEMLVNYIWNVELSEALYPALQAIEVSVRNGVHSAASARYGTEFWFDRPGVLLPRDLGSIARARQRLIETQKSPTAGRIIAALTFGFWPMLFRRPYERPVPPVSAQRLSWADDGYSLLRAVFPGLPRRLRNRATVWKRLDETARLRNRVFHYEPIWNRPYLDREHEGMLEAIGWVSPEFGAIARLSDRFPDVHRNGRVLVEAKLARHLGMA